MQCKRKIELISRKDIKKYLNRRYEANNTIINNSSLETYKIKQRFGDKLLSFFNIFLTATLLSSFILYDNPCKIKTFLLILLICGLILFIYEITIFKRFFSQYLRQSIYRNINIEISIIQNDIEGFFCINSNEDQKNYISIETLNSFFNELYLICKTKNKINCLKQIFKKEWIGINVAMILTVLAMIILFIFLIL